jgi:alkaline phosphatase D
MLQTLRLVDFDEPWIRQLDPNIPRNAGLYLNGTQWDGYQAERDEILSHWESVAPDDNLVLTGDIHSWWVGNVVRDVDDPASKKIAAEFVGGSVTSPSFENYLNTTVPLLNGVLRDVAGRLEYVNLFDHGYGVIEITPTDASVKFRAVDVEDPAAGVETLAEFRVERGSPVINRVA